MFVTHTVSMGIGANDGVEQMSFAVFCSEVRRSLGGHVARYPQLDVFGNQRLDIT
jgi:hypothetical protein